MNTIQTKSLSLIALTLQNSLLTILLHHSRTLPSNKLYSAPSAVLLSEILKSIISFSIPIIQSIQAHLQNSPNSPAYLDKNNDSDTHLIHRPLSNNRSQLSLIIINQIKINVSSIFSRDAWKLSIPAVLYVIQNNLQFVAASHLDVATFSVTYQLKILTTALCSVLILRRRLSLTKWISLLFLAIGVGLVQLENVSGRFTENIVQKEVQVNLDRTIGFMAVFMACLTSGLAGVYFELVLKSSNKVDLWIRNVQLSLFSLPPALFTAMASSSSSEQPIFAHFGFWAWITVLTQVFGGLVTALVIKFADNILKGFATSLSIILSTLVGVFLFNDSLPFGSTLGALIVLISTYTYNLPSNEIVSSPLPSTSKQPSSKVYNIPSDWKLQNHSSQPFVIQFDGEDSSTRTEDNEKKIDLMNGNNTHNNNDYTKEFHLSTPPSTLISPNSNSTCNQFPNGSTQLDVLVSPASSSWTRNPFNHSSNPSDDHYSK